MPNVDVVPKLELHLHSFIPFKLSKGVLFYILKPLILSDFKVEIFSKGSLDLIPSPSPSVKIQLLGKFA